MNKFSWIINILGDQILQKIGKYVFRGDTQWMTKISGQHYICSSNYNL